MPGRIRPAGGINLPLRPRPRDCQNNPAWHPIHFGRASYGLAAFHLPRDVPINYPLASRRTCTMKLHSLCIKEVHGFRDDPGATGEAFLNSRYWAADRWDIG